MINLILTSRSGEQKSLRLPLHGEDAVQPYLSSFLAYGTASVEFETPSHELRTLLSRTFPEKLAGGIEELNRLAHVLDNMNGQQLQRLEKSLAADECDFAEMSRRTFYYGYHAFDKNGTPNPNAKPLEDYDPYMDRLRLDDKIQRRFENELTAQRLSGGQLFEKTMEQARANSDTARFDAICDYALPQSQEGSKLSRYEFAFAPVVNFGGSEGIYVDCYLKGRFDETKKNSMHIGTLKTLSDDLDACKVMGELCGILLYHESKYVNQNLMRFDSDESIKRMLSNPLKMEPVPAQTADIAPQML